MFASRRKVLFQGETHCNVLFHSFVLDCVTFSVSEKTEEIVSVLPLIEKAAKKINVAIYRIDLPLSVFCDLAVISYLFVCG